MKIVKLSINLLVATALLASCAGGKYAKTEKVYKKQAKELSKLYKQSPVTGQLEKVNVKDQQWIASINFGIRKPNFVVIHHTAQDSLGQTIRTFHSAKAGVSSHYVVGRDGKVVQMVNDLYRAHHAGLGKWGNDTDLNSSSIGIELDNNGTTDPWTDAQINALTQLLAYLKTTYRIPQANFIGHMDLAPTRKNDPSRFPWKKLADQGFGFWYEDYLETPPADFNPKMALRIIGYDVSNPDAAIKAFKIHYIQQDVNTAFMGENDLKILYSIYKKFL
ncbi:N-acetylmuramoyl-L-alanine amidase [Sphingobacterium multivorum]|jgi:N-acetylmuramoyl-L-alanine amidase|uniref:N-acetylmuramoyl-L-alanine amidase n=1 Tax=Sphingobacterium multivorum TaxID=28454 RepID=UPI000E92D673|nr:N-acetylmuramoyl-L-alanine amidase [Sphingobacterium multivorum]MDF2852943.1 N-acetylmuramoyl-L-alanine amidase [Sphingobacterium multivorum]QQT63690.1 N-acetylmuramoyl-L-alanine amidase [Sphingobacterium multivorum]HAU53906.1 N-acetylmuramoyl-L-alanine amidase [Sphingobacterium sp.]